MKRIKFETTVKVTAVYDTEDIGTEKTDEEFAHDLIEFIADELTIAGCVTGATCCEILDTKKITEYTGIIDKLNSIRN